MFEGRKVGVYMFFFLMQSAVPYTLGLMRNPGIVCMVGGRHGYLEEAGERGGQKRSFYFAFCELTQRT